MPRQRKEIDKTDFEGLLALQCTLEEITAFFDHKLNGCSEDTIERWCKRTYKRTFADISAEKRKVGLISLRRSQFRLAEKNAAMAIFLGKNYLGQTDAREQKVELSATDAEKSKLDSILQQITSDASDDSEE